MKRVDARLRTSFPLSSSDTIQVCMSFSRESHTQYESNRTAPDV